MTLKKVLGFILVICMIFSFTACGVKSSEKDDGGNSGKGSKTTSKDKGGLFGGNNGSDETTGDEDTGSSGEGDNSSSGNSSGSDKSNPLEGMTEVDLPKGYPSVIFPLPKDSIVTYAVEEEYNGCPRFSVLAGSTQKVDKLTSYFDTLLGGAEKKNDTKGDGFYNTQGRFKGYDFNILITGDTSSDKNATMITLQITEVPTLDTALNSVETADLPEKYPTDKFPVVNGGKVFDAQESESDGKVSYSVYVYTSMSFKDIVAFYESSLGTITDKNKSVGTDDFNLSGTANGYYFYITGYKTQVNGVDVSQYSIDLDPAQ